jgi:hypothetical protein
MLLQTVVDAMNNEAWDTVAVSTIAVGVVQWLKNSKWIPFMDQHTSTINRIVSWAAAFCSATGIHYTFDHGTGTLTLTGLTVMGLWHSFGDTVKSYAVQWLIYRGVKNGLVPAPTPPPAG